jgi:hypothetical protein
MPPLPGMFRMKYVFTIIIPPLLSLTLIVATVQCRAEQATRYAFDMERASFLLKYFLLGTTAEDVKKDRRRKEVASRLSREMSDRRDEWATSYPSYEH